MNAVPPINKNNVTLPPSVILTKDLLPQSKLINRINATRTQQRIQMIVLNASSLRKHQSCIGRGESP